MYAIALVLELVVHGSVFDFGKNAVHHFDDGFERRDDGRFAPILFGNASDGAFLKSSSGEIAEEFLRSFLSVDYGLKLLLVSKLADDARLALRVEEALELAVEAVGTDTGAEVFSGDFGSRVGFVDDEEIVGQQNAFGVGRESSGI